MPSVANMGVLPLSAAAAQFSPEQVHALELLGPLERQLTPREGPAGNPQACMPRGEEQLVRCGSSFRALWGHGKWTGRGRASLGGASSPRMNCGRSRFGHQVPLLSRRSIGFHCDITWSLACTRRHGGPLCSVWGVALAYGSGLGWCGCFALGAFRWHVLLGRHGLGPSAAPVRLQLRFVPQLKVVLILH